MDITLLAVGDSVPRDCLCSVRSGTTRRQAPIDLETFLLRFPHGHPKTEPLKVDFLLPIGSASVDVSASADSYSVKALRADGGQPLMLSMCVREDGTERAGELTHWGCEDQTFIDARRKHLAVEARSYLDQHSLLAWMQDLLQDLVRDQPADPWAYIDAHRAGKRSPAHKVSFEAATDTRCPSSYEATEVVVQISHEEDLDEAAASARNAMYSFLDDAATEVVDDNCPVVPALAKGEVSDEQLIANARNALCSHFYQSKDAEDVADQELRAKAQKALRAHLTNDAEEMRLCTTSRSPALCRSSSEPPALEAIQKDVTVQGRLGQTWPPAVVVPRVSPGDSLKSPKKKPIIEWAGADTLDRATRRLDNALQLHKLDGRLASGGKEKGGSFACTAMGQALLAEAGVETLDQATRCLDRALQAHKLDGRLGSGGEDKSGSLARTALEQALLAEADWLQHSQAQDLPECDIDALRQSSLDALGQALLTEAVEATGPSPPLQPRPGSGTPAPPSTGLHQSGKSASRLPLAALSASRSTPNLYSSAPAASGRKLRRAGSGLLPPLGSPKFSGAQAADVQAAVRSVREQNHRARAENEELRRENIRLRRAREASLARSSYLPCCDAAVHGRA